MAGQNGMLSLVHLFGLSKGVKGSLHYLDENSLVYPCGHAVVFYQIESREQTLLTAQEESGGITAMAMTATKRYLAVAERAGLGGGGGGGAGGGAASGPGDPAEGAAMGGAPSQNGGSLKGAPTPAPGGGGGPGGGPGGGGGAQAAGPAAQHATISIFDAVTLKRRKLLVYPELGSAEVAALAFSADGRFCLAQGGAPAWQTVLWAAEKAAKVLCTARPAQGVPPAAEGSPEARLPAVAQADFCPTDPTAVCVSGRGFLKFYRVAENQFRPVPAALKGHEAAAFLCHAWVNDDRVLAGTAAGEVLVVDGLELKAVVGQGQAAATGVPCGVTALAVWAKGFVAGGAGGQVRVHERSDDPREPYRCARHTAVGPGGGAPGAPGAGAPVAALCAAPSEDALAVATGDRQLLQLPLGGADLLKEDGQRGGPGGGPGGGGPGGGGGNGGSALALAAPFHGPGPSGSAQVTGIDTCVWKTLVATCGLDRSVRVWNYRDKTVEVMKYFGEEAYSIALHPSGLHVVVGFAEKLRYMSLLMDDIRVVKELPVKGCREVKFAPGGQLFAAAGGSTVTVYHSYTFEQVATLRAHNGRVRAVLWQRGGLKLLTAGMDGAAYLWDVATGQRESEYPQHRYNFHAATATPDLSRALMVGNEGPIKDFDVALMNFKEDLPCEPGAAAAAAAPGGGAAAAVGGASPLARLLLPPHQRALYAATAAPDRPGLVLAYKLAPSPQALPEAYLAHGGAVTAAALTADGRCLFTGAEDGSLAAWACHDVDARGGVRLRAPEEAAGRAEFADEVLVARGDLDAREKRVRGLRAKVDELNLNNEYQLRLKDMNYLEKTKEVTAKFQADVEMDRRRFDELQEEKRHMELEYEERLQELEAKHKKEHRELETQYKNKINAEVARFQQLKADEEEQNRFWDEENQGTLEKNEGFLKAMEEEYQAKVEEEQTMQKRLAEEKKAMEVEFTRLKDLIEEDADLEIDEVKQKYLARLQSEKDATLRLKGENSIMKKKYLGLQKDVATNEEEIKGLQEQEQNSHEVIHGLEKDIQGHKKEIREREETIADKEKRIYDLKKKNQELEKFKFVLDYKIKELKRQIEPRENEIADMRAQIEEMDLELEQYHKSNAALDLMIGELRLKGDGLRRELGAQERALLENAAYIDRYRRDLHQALQNFTHPAKLKKDVVALYKQYVQEDVLAGASFLDGDAQRAYNRQREHLERNVAALKRNVAKDFVMHEKDAARLRRENAQLTREINQLRREAQATRLGLQDVARGLGEAGRVGFSRTGSVQAPGSAGRTYRELGGTAPLRSHSAGGGGGGLVPMPPGASSNGAGLPDPRLKEIEMQRQQIAQLEEQHRRLQEALAYTPRQG